MRSRSALAWLGFLSASLAVATVVACGNGNAPSGSGGGFTTATNAGGSGAASPDGGGGSFGIGVGGFNHSDVKSLEVKPDTAKLDVQSGSTAAVSFKAIAHYENGSSGEVGASWSADALATGAVDGHGKFTANGTQGGVVEITASFGGKKATAKLTVVLHVLENPANADAATQMSLKNASTADASVKWAYPYDKTAFPRGVGAPILMWNNGGAPDVYYVHITSDTFELEAFTNAAPPSRYQFSTGVWDQFANSTSGAAELKVARWDGTNATVIVDHHDQIANGAMHGTIYYWSINTGRVMRIQPGAGAPDDFFMGVNLVPPAQGACVSCHTVSSNGERIVLNAGHWDNSIQESSISYDLIGNTTDYAGMLNTQHGSPFALAGLSADGKHLLQNYAPLRSNIAQGAGIYDSTTAAKITGTGIDDLQAWMPAWSPDNKLIAYVAGQAGDLHVVDWDGGANPPQGTNDRKLVDAGTDNALKFINSPTITPDHKWVMYQRSSGFGSLGIAGNLYLASVENPGVEIPLDALNGTGYPFAAGARDASLNFEPTFAPVASGGYFWVVFHSRRTWGNQLTNQAYCGEGCGTKQLWVAAIDQNPQGSGDPSHASFHLPGQALDTLNMRGYWALPPCKADGKSCESGVDCCGGFCDTSGDSGTGVCKSNSGGDCSKEGDHCDKTADCCNGTCINNHCANQTPH